MILINLFGGPGCGKSTAASYIFAKLKMLGINVELASEFAKDKTWEGNMKAITCQPYIIGNQIYRIDRCKDDVDVIVTDSPIILAIFYNQDKCIEPYFSDMLVHKHHEYNNLNFMLERTKSYNPKGRNQTEDEAKCIDMAIRSLLNDRNIDFETFEGNLNGYEKIIGRILAYLDKNS